MTDDDDRRRAKRGLRANLGRARALLGKARDKVSERRGRSAEPSGELATGAAPPQGGLPARVVETLVAPLMRAVGGRLVDLTDLLASRLLELDAGAAEMAVFVERIAQTHGHMVVMTSLFRHNLVLDGTFLALMQPLLAGARPEDGVPSVDPAVLDRARDTLTTMILELAALDEGESPDGNRLDWLEEIGFGASFPNVFAWLEGRASPEDDARFIFSSYLTFLQTFVMRTLARNLADLPALTDAGPSPAPMIEPPVPE